MHRFLQVLVWLQYFKAKTYIASLPIGLQNGLAVLLASLARQKGYKAVYKEYSGLEA